MFKSDFWEKISQINPQMLSRATYNTYFVNLLNNLGFNKPKDK